MDLFLSKATPYGSGYVYHISTDKTNQQANQYKVAFSSYWNKIDLLYCSQNGNFSY